MLGDAGQNLPRLGLSQIDFEAKQFVRLGYSRAFKHRSHPKVELLEIRKLGDPDGRFGRSPGAEAGLGFPGCFLPALLFSSFISSGISSRGNRLDAVAISTPVSS